MKHWTLDDIAWEEFDPAKLDPDLVRVVKAASLVEKNGSDYGRYLKEVFSDDPAFAEVAVRWAEEEVQHGDALGRWAGMADPSFDFHAAFEDFAGEIRLPAGTDRSVRGSRVGELVARCVVECGTSSMYAALAESAEEPVLKDICRRIAADELRHYKLFYEHKKRYLKIERVGRLRRIWVALSRATEMEDGELGYAYYAANRRDGRAYNRRAANRAYALRVYSFYRYHHVERAVSMVFKAAGLKPHGRLSTLVSRAIYAVVKRRTRHARRSRAQPAAA